MKSLLKYLKDYKKESILAPLFKMLEASFELLVPLVMAAVIDKGIEGKDKNYIVSMCFVMILLGLIGFVCSITAQYFAAKAATGFARKLRYEMFSHIQKLSYSKLDTAGTSTLITRMTSDVNQVQSGVNMFLRLFLRSPFIVIGAMVMAFYVDVHAAVVFAVAIPLLSLVVFGIIFANIPLYKKVQNRLDKVLLVTRENLNGIRVIRAFNQEEEEIEAFDEKNTDLTKIQLFAGRISALLNPITYVIINLALVALLYKGALRVDGGYITQGDVIALISYMSQILVELVKLANLIVTLTKAAACASRIQGVMEIPEGMEEEEKGNSAKEKSEEKRAESTHQSVETGSDEAVRFYHVGFIYEGAGGEVLTDMDFSVKKGETVGIIGGTGSGKSTLVQLIPRFYDASTGNIYVDGKEVREYEVEELRNKVGMVPQKAALFKGTIRENILFGRENATDEMIEEAITVAQAKEFVEAKEGGLSFKVEQGGRNLSGGQKQRLTIARALVRQPEILILDDSCSALDYATDAALRAGIKGLSYKPTVFIVSQRTASIQYADKIIVLDDGEIAGMGTHEELLRTCQVYQEIYDSQYKKEGR
ncbi:MAG: ABC transporter ATP-binding protein [Lachnospiraceae bacterium]|nr:ABC transporter ATP-binding protein [Lachnospiraceae bacterium]